jgi:hypothetical protein
MKKFLSQLIIGIGLAVLFSQSASAQWVRTNGVSGGEVHSLAVSGTNIFAGTIGGGVFLSTDNGTSWKKVINSGYFHALAVSGSNIFAANAGTGIYLSTNNGTNWAPVNSGLDKYVFSLAASGINIFAGTDGSGIYLSTNNGTNWTEVNSGLTNKDVRSLAVSPNAIYAGTADRLFLSVNNVISWNSVDLGITLARNEINALLVHGNNIFAGSPVDLLFSTNKGTTWDTTRILGLGDAEAFAAIGNNVFAGGGIGIFLSTNNGTSWNSVSSNAKIYAYSLAICDGFLFAGATDSSVWRRPLSEMVGVFDQKIRREIIQQSHFKISPSRSIGSIATIEFVIPHSDQVAVAIFDIAGGVISTLVNRHLDQGSHRYFWDTQTLAGGCYLVRLQVGAFSCIKTIQILN